jgi:hypothetical protein
MYVILGFEASDYLFGIFTLFSVLLMSVENRYYFPFELL